MQIVFEFARDRHSLGSFSKPAEKDPAASATVPLEARRRAFQRNPTQMLGFDPLKALALASIESSTAHMAAIAKPLDGPNGNP